MGSGTQGAGVTLEKRSISGPRCPPTTAHPSEPLLAPLPRMPSLVYPTPQGSDVFTLLSSRQENRPAPWRPAPGHPTLRGSDYTKWY